MSDMEWMLAQQWVISTGVSVNNKSLQSSSHLGDFAQSLRDGVILCRVANALKPYSVKCNARKIQNIEQHEFLCKRNIALFLRTCSDVFQIKSNDLFTTSDLYNLTNFGAVVTTLSVLSHHKHALSIPGCLPFSVIDQSNRCEVEDHHTYGSLLEEINEKDYIRTESDFGGDIYAEEIYSNSAYQHLILCKAPPMNTTSSTGATISTKREHIVSEILATEEEYMKLMRTIVQSYIPALKPHITVEDETTIFLNIDQIYTLHLNFYRELSSPERTPGSAQKIDISAFSRYKKRFLIYAFYCTHLDESQRLVDQLLKNPAFLGTVDELNRKLKRDVLLKGQLCVCFQRVLKYPLLLAQLLKNTPENHNEHVIVKNALAAMEDVASYINEFKRDHDVVLEIEHIQQTLKFRSTVIGSLESLHIDFGRHLHDGELQVQFEGTHKREDRIAFLFEQALLLCRANGSYHEVHDIMCLQKVTVKDSQPSWKGRFSQVQGKFSHCFTLKTSGDDDNVQAVRSCRIFTKNEQMKRSWMEAIRKCIKAVTLQDYEGKLNNHVFRLATFDCDKCYTCDVCQKLLLGQVSQGYLCRNGDCQFHVHVQCLQSCPPCQYSELEHLSLTSDNLAKGKTNDVTDQRRKTAEEVMELLQERSPTRQSVPTEESLTVPSVCYSPLEQFHWFSGQISRDQSEDLLSGFPNGSFLIRENKGGSLVLSVQCNNISFHIKIKEEFGQVYLSDCQRFRSIEDMISYYQTNSLSSTFPPLPTMLTDLIRNTYT